MDSPHPHSVALSVGPTTVQAANLVRLRAEHAGFTVREFPADGQGGRALEAAITAGDVSAVVDLTLSEIATGSAGQDRLTAASLVGVPQVISPGGLDQLDLRELDQVSKQIALKASASGAAVAILIPEGRWSDDGALDREKLRVVTECLRLWLSPHVELQIIPGALGDAAFAEAAIATLTRFITAAAGRCPSK